MPKIRSRTQSYAPKLDELDRRILRVLQKNGRIANNDLAAEVGLSPSPCLRRVKRLEEDGVIKGYVALVDPNSIGKGITLFIRVWLKAQDEQTLAQFSREISKLPQVLECHLMLGDCDALVRVVAADIDEYRRFQADHLSRIKVIQSVKTDVPSQIVKHVTELPL